MSYIACVGYFNNNHQTANYFVTASDSVKRSLLTDDIDQCDMRLVRYLVDKGKQKEKTIF